MFFITRIIFTMMFWVVIARWSYSEIAHASPTLRKSIDNFLEIATIPTHDRWDLSAVKEVAENIVAGFDVEKAYAAEGE